MGGIKISVYENLPGSILFPERETLSDINRGKKKFIIFQTGTNLIANFLMKESNPKMINK